ncbi:UPAR/Ly6 domain-containing protein qvr-like isoform X2 [Lineus longissimus]|uniref:UPAR/Ly6 domain-containing protein qvr-like isoform X2 n=1 Tax=Lineus longissimus TaxID=88925 RepID=UPI002B4D551A
MEIRRFTVILLCSFLTSTGGDMGEGEIECYFCEGDAKNSTCANNGTDFDLHPDVRVGMCKKGMCVKWARRKNGTMWLERTCTYAMENFHLIVSDDCRKEKYGNGFICMCGRDKCNSSLSINGRYHTLTTVTLSVLTSVLALYGCT